jgi:DNA-binding NarL/FixJ family response regulator
VSNRFVVVVEDEPFLRSLISDALTNAGFEVEAFGNAADAMRRLAKRDPDAAILDIDLGPGPTGLDIGEFLLAKSPGTAVVYLTMLSDPRVINPESGKVDSRAAYLNKRKISNTEELLDALEAVLHDDDISEFRHDQDPASPISQLSKSQLKVLKLVAKGLTNQQIADERGRSLSATEAIISRTFAALGIDISRDSNGRILAVREFFVQAGIVLRDEKL